MKSTLYGILQIGEKASQEEIAAAYHVRKNHLANAGDQESQNESTLVQQAFEILSDQNQRARYDRRLSAEAAADVREPIAMDEAGHGGLGKWLLLLVIVVAAYMAYQKLYVGRHASGTATPAAQIDVTSTAVHDSEPSPQQSPAQAQPAPADDTKPSAAAPATESSPQPPSPVPAPPQPIYLPARPADINDIDLVPFPNPTTQRKSYVEFLSIKSSRAFLICSDNSVMVVQGNTGFVGQRLAQLRDRCTPYAIDDAVVWVPK